MAGPRQPLVTAAARADTTDEPLNSLDGFFVNPARRARAAHAEAR